MSKSYVRNAQNKTISFPAFFLTLKKLNIIFENKKIYNISLGKLSLQDSKKLALPLRKHIDPRPGSLENRNDIKENTRIMRINFVLILGHLTLER